MEILYHHVLTACGQPADVLISALQKSIRRGNTEDAVRSAYELYLTGEELTEYVWKRLIVISAEDIGLGCPEAPGIVLSLYNASKILGRDSMDYPLLISHAVRFLCTCSKERGSSTLISVIKRRVRDGVPFELPDYVYDMHTVEGQNNGRGIEHFLKEAAIVNPAYEAPEGREYWEKMEEELIRRRKED